MSIGDVVKFNNIPTPTELVISKVVNVWEVEVMYFDKNNIIRKEIILKSLLQ